MTDSGCKVCRVLHEYDLEHYDERLLERWTADGERRMGYRQLARWLNVTLLRREMDRAGLSTLGDEAESKYDRLQKGDASAAEVERMLEQAGVDIEGLQSSFVSYSVLRTHIVDCLDERYDPTEPKEWERKSIDIAREHAAEKISEAVSSLLRKDRIRGTDEIDVSVSVELECESCQLRVPLERALRRDRVCDCDSPRPEEVPSE